MFIKFIAIIFLSLITIGQTNIYGQNANENLPVPNFDLPAERVIADDLRETLLDMRRHLCNKPKNETEKWRSEFEKLFRKLVVAQHRTMWAAAGNFDLLRFSQSLNLYYIKKDEIIGFLDKAARQNQANAGEIQGIIERFNAKFLRFKEAAYSSDFGRNIFEVYINGAALAELDKELPVAKLRKFGIPEGDYSGRRNRAFLALTDTLQLLYTHAVNRINSKIPANAPRFSVYSSTDYFFPQDILNAVTNTIPVSFDINKFESLQDETWHTYAKKAFNESELRGQCEKEKVRIIFAPSRRADADQAKQTLEENGFEVTLLEVLETASNQKGKVYYQNKGNYDRANIISGMVRNIEKVNPDSGTDSTDAPDYSLWIIGKKEITNPLIDLNGEWTAEGYKCNGKSTTQIVKIQHKGNQVIASKVVGNECIEAGAITFRGNYTQNPFAIEVQTTFGSDNTPRFTPGTMRVVNANLINLTTEIGNITLTRKIN